MESSYTTWTSISLDPLFRITVASISPSVVTNANSNFSKLHQILKMDLTDTNMKAFEVHFSELIEEVKHFREFAADNELKYYATLEIKSSLEQKLKDQEQNHRLQIQEYEKSVHTKNQKIAEEKLNASLLLRKKDLQMEILEKERDSLKQEMRGNTVELYESCRKIATLDQEIKIEKKSRIAAEKYAEKLEEEIPKLEATIETLQEDVIKLSNCAKETVQLARAVDKSFNHSDCLIEDARRETERANKRHLEAEAKLVQFKAGEGRRPLKEEPNDSQISGFQELSNRVQELKKSKTELIISNTKSSELLDKMRNELESERVLREKIAMESEEYRLKASALKSELEKIRLDFQSCKESFVEHNRICGSRAEITELKAHEQRCVMNKMKADLKVLDLENERLRLDLSVKDQTDAACQSRILQLEAEVEQLMSRKEAKDKQWKGEADSEKGSHTPHSTTGDA